MSALDTARVNLRETLETHYMDRETLMDIRVVLDELNRLERLPRAIDAQIERTKEIIELLQEEYPGAAFLVDTTLAARHPEEAELVAARIRQERLRASS